MPDPANSPDPANPPDHASASDASSFQADSPTRNSSAKKKLGSLSAQIARRYECQLPDDLADWFDSRTWEQTAHGEFCDPVSPSTLLDSAPEVIWPGLMPCDFLPLIGSRAGDWLGVKLDRDNQASEIIQWYHGGGDWIPWGKTISEAIVFGAVCHRLPGPRRRHAIPANDFRETTCESIAADPLLRWANDHFAIDHCQLIDPTCAGNELSDLLLQHDIAEVAVRCELVQDALCESLSEVLNHRTGQAIDIDWPTAVSWMFDLDQIPDSALRNLQTRYGYRVDAKQDWQSAQEHARRVTELSPEIAWGWDLLGYCLEKTASFDEAADAYRQGVTKSIFSDQSVKLRTHWTAEIAAKFSAARLLTLFGEQVDGVAADYFAALTDGSQEQRRIAVKDYWLTAAQQSSNDAEKHDALVSAGWDLGAEPITAFGDILSQIATADESQTARNTLAATHRECLKQRYGI